MICFDSELLYISCAHILCSTFTNSKLMTQPSQRTRPFHQQWVYNSTAILIIGMFITVESSPLHPTAFVTPISLQRTSPISFSMYKNLVHQQDDWSLGYTRPNRSQTYDDRQDTKLQQSLEDDDTKDETSLRQILVIVLPLLLIYVSNQWSRYSISYLVDFSDTTTTSTASNSVVSAFKAMNIDLQFTEAQYGFVASTAFTILFALSSLIAGDFADKYNRKILTLISCSVWALATIYTSQAHTYNEVLLARVIMGGSCAFSIPAAYSIISERVSKDTLAFSNSIYGSGVYIGGSLSSLSLLLDESLGWRGALEVIGGFGVVSIVVAGLFLPSDDDRNSDKVSQEGNMQQNSQEETNLVQNTLQLLSIPRVRYIYFGSFIRFCSGLMIAIWKATYYKETFPDNTSEFAIVNALIVGVIGLSSGILGGSIADGLSTWIQKQDTNQDGLKSIASEYFNDQTIRLLLPIIGSLVAIPFFYLTTHTKSTTNDAFEAAMFWLALEYVVAECWFGPTTAVLQSSVDSSKTGQAQGLFVLTGAMGNLAPSLLGVVYGNQIATQSSLSSSQVLGNLLSFGVCLGYLLSSILFALAVNASSESDRYASKEQ